MICALRKTVGEDEFTDIGQASFFTDRDSTFQIDFDAVVLRWIVGSGDGDRKVDPESASRKMDHGSGDDTEIDDIAPLIHDSSGECLKKGWRRGTDITADSDFGGLEVDDERPADSVGSLIIEINAIHTTDIIRLENTGIHSQKEWGIIACSISWDVSRASALPEMTEGCGDGRVLGEAWFGDGLGLDKK
jgi:hypothetical protein